MKLLLENVRGLFVLVGAYFTVRGIHAISPAAADICGGLAIVAIGIYPYVRQRKA